MDIKKYCKRKIKELNKVNKEWVKNQIKIL